MLLASRSALRSSSIKSLRQQQHGLPIRTLAPTVSQLPIQPRSGWECPAWKQHFPSLQTPPSSYSARQVHQLSSIAACRAVRSSQHSELKAPEPTLIDRAKGWALWSAIMAASFPIVLAQACVMLLMFLRSPRKFLGKDSADPAALPDLMPGVEHQHLEVNGIRLHVASMGRAAGKPLMLLLHGFPESWISWRHQLEAFSSDYHVAAVDLRGYGQSSKPKGRQNYALEVLVDDVKGVVQALGHDQCVLVGHDWGGALAWTFAYAYPSMVSHLVTMCGPHPAAFIDNLDWNQFKRSWYIGVFQWPLLPELMMRSYDYAFVEAAFSSGPMACKTPGAVSAEHIAQFKQGLRQPNACTAALDYYRAFVDSATRFPSPAGAMLTRDEITSRKLEIPTLVLWADSDGALGPQLLRGLPGYVPDVSIHTLKKCSHWIQQDRPGEVNALMSEFLKHKAGRGSGSQKGQQGAVAATAA